MLLIKRVDWTVKNVMVDPSRQRRMGTKNRFFDHFSSEGCPHSDYSFKGKGPTIFVLIYNIC